MIEIKLKNPDTGQFEECSVSTLTTPRLINGVEFDGSQDITIPTGSSDYQSLTNKPKINGVELDGEKTTQEFNIKIEELTYPIDQNGYILKDYGTFEREKVNEPSELKTLYLTSHQSAIPGVFSLEENPDTTATQYTITTTSGENLIKSYIFDKPIGVSRINPSRWFVRLYMESSPLDTLHNIAQVYIVAYNSSNVKRIIPIGLTEALENGSIVFESNQQHYYEFDPTDRIGIDIKCRANAGTSVTLYVNTNVSYIGVPFPKSHGDLIDLNSDNRQQHITLDEKNNGALSTGVTNPSPISGVDLSTINKVATIVDNNIVKVIIDLASTTKTVSLLNNNDVQLGTLTNLTISSLPSGMFIASISFTSGVTSTTFSYPTGVKWIGTDCITGNFIPVANKRYNIVFWYDGVNVNGVVGGFL